MLGIPTTIQYYTSVLGQCKNKDKSIRKGEKGYLQIIQLSA